ncbi:extracellular solute-binding protein [uncultured Paenibacillus sp.]|uniref:ABC transporter substrate-binding protein n=1 Tax=uncultured Paenibacillus sp. TaxID=227322 RepID=UPI0015ADA910|nr:extracellular solute-binding protein [uncultured Paenibacillus sp.]
MRSRAIWRWLPPVMALLLLLAACRPSPQPPAERGDLDILLDHPEVTQADPDRIVLHLLSFHTGQEFEFWKWLGEQYTQEHPNVEIQVDFISSDDYFTDSKLLASFASGHGPDVFFVSPGTIRRFENAGILEPLTAEFTPEIRRDFNDAALESVTLGGQIYAVPFETELLGLYYNEAMFREKGIRPPATWAELETAAQALKAPGVSGLTMETFQSVYQNFAWLPFLWQTGVDLVSEDGRTSGLDVPGADKMFRFFRDMADRGLLNMHPSRPTTDIGILASGETAMQVSGTWNIRMLETIYADKPIGVVPLPVPDGRQPVTIAGGWKIGVNHFSKNADEAKKFVMWAFAGEPELPLKWVGEVKFAYSPRKSVMEAGGELYQKGLRRVFTEQIYGTERQEPQYPAEISGIFTDSLQRLLYGGALPDELAASTYRQITDYLTDSEK